MQPRSLLLLLQALLPFLPRRAPILAGADPAKSRADFPYCDGQEEKEPCGVCTSDYQLWQPCEVWAWARGAVVLRCAFWHSWGRTWEARVSWLAGHFKSSTIVFNDTHSGGVPVHANFTGRASLVGDPRSGNASLLIEDLRPSDSNLYFCRVGVSTERSGWQEWQGIKGTRLSVTATAPLPPSRPPGTEDPKETPPRSPLGPALGGAAAVLLALALLGAGLFLARRRGYCRRPPPERSGLTVEKEEPRGGPEYEDVGPMGSKAPPPPPPEDPHLFYAALMLSEAGREGKACPPPSETTYAAIRT